MSNGYITKKKSKTRTLASGCIIKKTKSRSYLARGSQQTEPYTFKLDIKKTKGGSLRRSKSKTITPVSPGVNIMKKTKTRVTKSGVVKTKTVTRQNGKRTVTRSSYRPQHN